ncbi:MAG: hypothetical protein LBK23_11690 [Oscillospiraceae bacterium]|jgi:phosphoadenosine phosphosulfate reductase|nr:hypothetical protein [Oscillospiraceae bacterium]
MYQTYKAAYLRAFEKMLEVKKRKGIKTTWKDGEEVFNWWVRADYNPAQMTMFDE